LQIPHPGVGFHCQFGADGLIGTLLALPADSARGREQLRLTATMEE